MMGDRRIDQVAPSDRPCAGLAAGIGPSFSQEPRQFLSVTGPKCRPVSCRPGHGAPVSAFPAFFGERSSYFSTRPFPCITNDQQKKTDFYSGAKRHMYPGLPHQIDQCVGNIDRRYDYVCPATYFS